MKVAILSFYSGHIQRGVENWADQLASELEPECSVTIFPNDLQVNWQAKDSRFSLARLIFLDYWSRKILQYTWHTLSKLSDFDVVIPTNGGFEAIFTRFYCWAKGKKMMIVGHSGRGWDDRINLYCFPDVFVGLSEFASSWARKINPFVKVVHIPNGVDLVKFSPAGSKVKLDLNKPIVLAIGAFELGKQLDLTIKAVAKTPYNLVVLGDGELKPRLIELATKLMPGRFLIAKVPFDQVPKYCRSADLFTLASWAWEAYPLVYFEAMACSLPVVATNDPVRHEIVGEAGLFVDPHDAEDYAAKILKAVSSDWGNKPRLQAEKFAWKNIAAQYEKILKDL